MTTIAILLIVLIIYIMGLWSDASRIDWTLTVVVPEPRLPAPDQIIRLVRRDEVERETWFPKATRAQHNPRKGKVWPRWTDEGHLLTVRRKKELSRSRAEGRAFKNSLR